MSDPIDQLAKLDDPDWYPESPDEAVRVLCHLQQRVWTTMESDYQTSTDGFCGECHDRCGDLWWEHYWSNEGVALRYIVNAVLDSLDDLKDQRSESAPMQAGGIALLEADRARSETIIAKDQS